MHTFVGIALEIPHHTFRAKMKDVLKGVYYDNMIS
jgi:hypothetical protein